MGSTTVERKSDKAAAALEAREARRVEVEQEIALLYEAEEEARFNVLLDDPSAKTTAITEEPAKLARRRETLETELRGLQKDIPQLREVVRIRAIEAQRDALDANTKIAEGLANSQRALWKQAGEQAADLFETWQAICLVAEEHDAFALKAEADFNAGEVRDEWSRVSALPIQPMPTTLRSFLDLLVKATIDPGNNGYRAGTEYTINQQDGPGATPREIKQTTGVVHLDDQDELIALLPDLRGSNRRPELSGRVAKREA